MTSARGEGTFLTLRLLKNYLQSIMTQKRLNHVVLLYTHKERVNMAVRHQLVFWWSMPPDLPTGLWAHLGSSPPPSPPRQNSIPTPLVTHVCFCK